MDKNNQSSKPESQNKPAGSVSLGNLLDLLVSPIRDYKSEAELKKFEGLYTPIEVLAQLHRQRGQTAEFPTMVAQYERIMGGISSMASEMGIKNVHVALMGIEYEFYERRNAHAFRSKEGNNYIFFNKGDFLDALQSPEAAATLNYYIGHELAHFYKDDNALHKKFLASMSNDYSRYRELKADIIGTGPLGTRDPLGAARAIENDLLEYASKSEHTMTMQESIKKTVAEFADLSFSHPSPIDRITTLRRVAVLMEEYEAKHRVVTHEDRVTEAQWLLDSLVAEQRARERGRVISPEAMVNGDFTAISNAITPEQKAIIDRMQSLHMQEVATHTAPLRPSGAPYNQLHK